MRAALFVEISTRSQLPYLFLSKESFNFKLKLTESDSPKNLPPHHKGHTLSASLSQLQPNVQYVYEALLVR